MFQIRNTITKLLALSFVSLALTAYAEPKQSPYCDHLARIQKDAAQGNTDAQAEFGWDYFLGRCVQKSNDDARKWLSLAAHKGHARSMAALAELYVREHDDIKAVQWAKRGADLGEPHSQSVLAWLYYRGIGVKKDHEAAAGWAMKSAVQGNSGGQELVGILYQEGDNGLTKDSVKADMWLLLSEKDADVPDHSSIRKKLEGQMTASDILEAHRRTDAWTASEHANVHP
jgi:TPR repeat protein